MSVEEEFEKNTNTKLGDLLGGWTKDDEFEYIKKFNKYLKSCLLTEREKVSKLEKEIAWFKSHTVKVDEYNSAV
jgi:hypothetical protein